MKLVSGYVPVREEVEKLVSMCRKVLNNRVLDSRSWKYLSSAALIREDAESLGSRP